MCQLINCTLIWAEKSLPERSFKVIIVLHEKSIDYTLQKNSFRKKDLTA